MIVSISGKGGVGKTTLAALILDELAHFNYPGRVLVVDADPAATLHLALGLPAPVASVADVRDMVKLDARAIRALPAGTSPAEHVLEQLRQAEVVATRRLREMSFDLMVMGRSEGPGCYCSVNAALKQALVWLTGSYDLVLLDNEAGLEHLSRYRLERVDLLAVVATPDRAAQAVAQQVIHTAGQTGLNIGETWRVHNRALPEFTPPSNGHQALIVPQDWYMAVLEQRDRLPVISLPENSPVRAALGILVRRILASCV